MTNRLALHVGAHTPRRSTRDSVARLSRLCAAAGVTAQTELVGEAATTSAVRRALRRTAGAVGANGLLVVSFAGHSQQPGGRWRETAWCLADGVLRLAEVGRLLAAAPCTATIVLVADTGYAGALARFVHVRATAVLLAACEEDQVTVDRGPVSEFVVNLEREALRAPDYTALADALCTDALRTDAPDAEWPEVWTNRRAARIGRPFTPLPWARGWLTTRGFSHPPRRGATPSTNPWSR